MSLMSQQRSYTNNEKKVIIETSPFRKTTGYKVQSRCILVSTKGWLGVLEQVQNVHKNRNRLCTEQAQIVHRTCTCYLRNMYMLCTEQIKNCAHNSYILCREQLQIVHRAGTDCAAFLVLVQSRRQFYVEIGQLVIQGNTVHCTCCKCSTCCIHCTGCIYCT